MERTLSLVLDDSGLMSLTLMKADALEIDKFTTKKFENSDEIREYYRKKIDEYLFRNKNYIEQIEKSTGKMFRGRIVILEAHEYNEELILLEKRVLYKKHLVAFKEIVKDNLTMKRFLQLERRGVNEFGFRKLISPFLVREIKYADFKTKTRVDFIRKEIHKSQNFYDILRIVIKAYKLERQNRPYLKTIEAIYKENKVESKSDILVDKKPEKEYFTIDGIQYNIDDIPFDLDDLRSMDTDFKPDGLGGNDEERIR